MVFLCREREDCDGSNGASGDDSLFDIAFPDQVIQMLVHCVPGDIASKDVIEFTSNRFLGSHADVLESGGDQLSHLHVDRPTRRQADLHFKIGYTNHPPFCCNTS